MIKKILVLMVIFLGFMISGCDEDYTEVKFKVIGEGTSTLDGTFTGYYIIDDDSPVYFTSSLLSSRTYYYESPTLEDFNQLEVGVRRDNYETPISIKVYEDGDRVKTVTLDADDEDDSTKYYSVTLDYDYEEGQDSDDDE